MARSRNIKPAFFKNEALAEVGCDTRLLFIGLWTLADREGRAEDRPKRIRAEIFPFDGFDVESMLTELQRLGFLTRYEVDGNKYIQITNFVKHQDPHYREKASEIPPMCGSSNEVIATGVTRTQRARILERDNFKCQHCGSLDHPCIDHVLPVSRGGDSSDDNLQVLCLPCNTKKGNKLDSISTSSQRRVDVKPSNSPSVPLIPDSLIPDSLIPDSLNTDSLIPPAPAKAAAKKNAPTMLAELGVEEQAAKDWLIVRKEKRAPLTQTALDDLVREAGKAGISVNDAVLICARRSWQGFNASWDWKGKGVKVGELDKDQAREGARARLFGGVENATK